MFNKEIYIKRRRALIDRMNGEKGLAIFIGNCESPAQYKDNAYKFRQDSSWLYFFGIDQPGFAAIIDLESGEETIYADDVEIDDIIWMGPQPSVRETAESVGIKRSSSYGAFSIAVMAAVVAGRPIHFLPASRCETMMKLSNLLGLNPEETTSPNKAGCPKASRPLTEAVIALRLQKEDVEIRELDEVCTLGQHMHTIARRGICTGIVEQEIVGEMEGFAISKGWGTSFPTILTQHGEIFHCHGHGNIIEPGRLMVIDAGLESNTHYASDFTRTYPTAGRFTQKQRDVYQIVYECNELAYSLTKPGVSYRDVHLAVSKHMLEGLSGLGLVNGDVDDMVADGLAGLFMPHGLGHNMGLDVHDMEDLGENLVGYDPDQFRSEQLGLGSLRMARRLRPGNVITDEPGIYFIPALIEQWKQERLGGDRINYAKLEEYYDFGGIRLEDDLLVTADGVRRLGKNRLPIAPDDVEIEMEKDKNL